MNGVPYYKNWIIVKQNASGGFLQTHDFSYFSYQIGLIPKYQTGIAFKSMSSEVLFRVRWKLSWIDEEGKTIYYKRCPFME